MAVIRINALQRFADLIASCVPELAGSICGGAASGSHKLAFPSLAITATNFKFYPDQAVLHRSTGASTGVFNVGRVQGIVQLRLGAQSSEQRYALGQQIMEKIFWSDIERPGIVVLTIPECHDGVVAFELDGDTWEDEKAFDRKWYSVITATLQLPALVGKGGVHDMQEIRVTLAEDLSTPFGAGIPVTKLETTVIVSSD